MYFNLNNPPSTQPPQPATRQVGELGTQEVGGLAEGTGWLTGLVQVLMYFGALLGVIVSGPLLAYVAGETATLQFSWLFLLISAGVALGILPVAAAAVNNAAPTIIQFALYFQHGVFWRLVFGAVENGITPGQ